ncbi:MAG: hypothetical protein NTZ90_08085 [Proteobacteria bacterium]|nr:hypothetical protein [Pseudomonadota bacterium]
MRHLKYLKSQSGNTAIMVAIAVAAGLGSSLYFAMDKTVLKQKDERALQGRDRSSQVNVSSLTQVAALMAYTKPNATADDPTALPYLFPDPYLNNNSVGATRAAPGNVESWQYQAPNVSLYAPDRNKLNATDFANYVTKGQRPKLTQPATVRFLEPIMDQTHSNWIVAYRAAVTTKTAGSSEVTSKATIPVPRIPVPTCTLAAQNGQKIFQPDNLINLTMSVSGVALNALVPTTAQQLAYGTLYGDYSGYKTVDISSKSTSIRNMNKAVYSWSVAAPRPLAAVDGTGLVPFTITVFLTPVDDSTPLTAKCTLDIQVSSPSSCKLWTDKASVSPGSCANISYGTVGNVVPGSFRLGATDLAGRDFSANVSATSSTTYRFCTPPLVVGSNADIKSIPPATLAQYQAKLKGWSVPQLTGLAVALKQQKDNLISTFPVGSPLLDLTISEVLGLIYLSPSQLSILPKLDFSRTWGLNTLNAAQQTALHKLDPALLDKLLAVDLQSIRILDTIPDLVINALNTYDVSSLTLYVNYQIQADSSPIDYVLNGSIQDSWGSTNSCVTHVTAGDNQCPYFGTSYPNYAQTVSIYVNYYGEAFNAPFDFSPGYPNWEVEAVANSPFDVVNCPADARCFALDWGTNRTPFVTVQPANSSSCQATVSNRIDLGCFAFHTKLRMADGSDREINQLKMGDLVFNPMNKRAMKIKRTTIGPEKDDLVVFAAAAKQVRVTTKHPMLTKHGVATAISLRAGDEIMNEQGAWQRIDSVSREKATLSVINVELDTSSSDPADHALLADGLITGDLYLQEQLSGGKLPYLLSPKLSIFDDRTGSSL